MHHDSIYSDINDTQKAQTKIDEFLNRIKRNSEDFEIIRKSSVTRKSVPSLNNTQTIGIKDHFKTVKSIYLSHTKCKDSYINRKRNWDSSSDEEIELLAFARRSKCEDTVDLKNMNVREVLNICKQSNNVQHNCTKQFDSKKNVLNIKNDNVKRFGNLSKNFYSENIKKERIYTETNSMPVTKCEKHVKTKKNTMDDFLNRITQKIKQRESKKVHKKNENDINASINRPQDVIQNMRKSKDNLNSKQSNFQNIIKSLKESQIYKNQEFIENYLQIDKNSEFLTESNSHISDENLQKQKKLPINNLDYSENSNSLKLENINKLKNLKTNPQIIHKNNGNDIKNSEEITKRQYIQEDRINNLDKLNWVHLKKIVLNPLKTKSQISETSTEVKEIDDIHLAVNENLIINSQKDSTNNALNEYECSQINNYDLLNKTERCDNIEINISEKDKNNLKNNICDTEIVTSKECMFFNNSDQIEEFTPIFCNLKPNLGFCDIMKNTGHCSEKIFDDNFQIISNTSTPTKSKIDKNVTSNYKCNNHLLSNSKIKKKDLVNTLKNNNRIRKTAITLLEDERLNYILTEEYEKHKKRQEIKNSLTSSDKINKLEKLVQQGVKGFNCINNKKPYMKRFRKGKLKIYRLKKLKRPSNSQPKVELNVENILQQLTQNFIEPESQLVQPTSSSSISTASSYITDETRSQTLSTGSQELSKPQQKQRMYLNNILKDKTLFYKYEDRVYSECDKTEIKMKIQNIFLEVFDNLTNGTKSVLHFRRQCLNNCIFKDGRLQFKSKDFATTSIDSNSVKSQNKFKLILYVMKKVQTLIETNTKLTKRELFYQMKDIVNNQTIMDNAINAVSCLLDVGMWALNIIAQKGLVFGDLKILLSNGETINCKVPGTLIPSDIEEIAELQSSAYFILVVEKESIFYKLIEENLANKLTRPFIMITGKGFPDLNTQLFLRKLWMVMSIPIFILVDADPDGIRIMLNYKFGSVKNAHVSHLLAVPNAKWLGILPSEIKDFDAKTQPLTDREMKLVQQLLRMPYMENNPEIVTELKIMLENTYKAGIEALIKSHTYLSEVYLSTKFYTHKFI